MRKIKFFELAVALLTATVIFILPGCVGLDEGNHPDLVIGDQEGCEVWDDLYFYTSDGIRVEWPGDRQYTKTIDEEDVTKIWIEVCIDPDSVGSFAFDVALFEKTAPSTVYIESSSSHRYTIKLLEKNDEGENEEVQFTYGERGQGSGPDGFNAQKGTRVNFTTNP